MTITSLTFKCTPCGVHVVVSNDASSSARVRAWLALANDERPTLMRCPVCVSQIELVSIAHRPAGEPPPRCTEQLDDARPAVCCELPSGHPPPHYSRTHDFAWTPRPAEPEPVDD